MGRAKKAFYVVAPILAFSYLAYEFVSQSVPTPITRKATPANDALVWISELIGSAPLAVILVAMGLWLSFYAYRNY